MLEAGETLKGKGTRWKKAFEVCFFVVLLLFLSFFYSDVCFSVVGVLFLVELVMWLFGEEWLVVGLLPTCSVSLLSIWVFG